VRIEDWRAERKHRRGHLRLLTSHGHEAPPQFDDDPTEEPLSPEVIASLVDLRERLKAKLFAPNPATRPSWSDLRPWN
jgi:hypothetical protein